MAELVEKNGWTPWKAEYLDEHDWWYVMECDMEPIESVEDKPNTRSTDNTTKFKYHVGDRVTSGGHTGQVIGIDAGNAHISYLVDFDEPGVGCHNGNAIGVTVGRQGTSSNCAGVLTFVVMSVIAKLLSDSRKEENKKNKEV